jgi:UDP-N-acetylmuramyl pentapeptide phosphotransferase/UDP-N-acetylglucosamine-1-phosphate transferase
LPAEALAATAFAVSLTVVLAVTPLAIRIAERTGFHDHPVGYKGHAKPTPYLGGAAVFTGYLFGALLAGAADSRLVWVLVFAILLWAIGTLDDRRTVTPTVRVLAEASAAAVLFAVGLGWSITGNDLVDLTITVIWVVALSNAFNLMDNMDGATCTVALFSSLGTAVIALVLGDETLAGLGLALTGACLGFLRYNLAGPARIFLGDGGSMPIGFVVAATIMALPLDQDVGWGGLAIGVLLAGLPLVDTSLVILSRQRAGLSVFQGGRDHLTHRLHSRLPSVRAVAAALGAVQAALCAGALWLSQHSESSTTVAWALLLGAGAATVAIMETRTWAPVRAGPHSSPDLAHAPTAPPRQPEPEPQPPSGRPLLHTYPLEVALVLIVAASCGLSPFFYGFYDLGTWGPIALGLLAVLLGLVIARPAIPRTTALVALSALAGMSVWALVSTGWAGSPGNALTEANRWMLYATLLAILLLLLRDDRLGRLLLAATTALVMALGLYVVIRMLSGDGDLFLGQRLMEPLGYVNGQATYFLLGFWPLVAVAERARRPSLSGAAIAGATVLASLMVLSETRAVVPAIVLSAAVLIAFVPGRVRRGWALVVVVAAVAAIASPLLHIYDQPGTSVSGASARDAALAILAAAAGAGVVWAGANAAATRVAASGAAFRRASAVALVAVTLGAVGVATATVNDPAHLISRQITAFKHLNVTGDDRTRFVSGGGNRYDYWRVAVDEFSAHPVRGVGAGSYQFAYFRERRTPEDIRQPHSIELQALAELGLVGGALVLIFIAAVLLGFARRASHARGSPSEAGLAVAAGGVFLVWLVHTSVDWIHLIPGVTGAALAAAAVLLAPWRRAAPIARGGVHKLVVAACAAIVVAAALFVGRETLADRHATNAQDALPTHPRQALAEADRSLALNHNSVSAHYTRSAAFAQLHDYAGARGSLLEAIRVEPENFVSWALLGDLAVRHGDGRQAQGYYRTALRLNPRDPQLQSLVKSPPAPPSP